MGYKQPGFGNGKKAPQVPDTNSPLNFLGGGKVKKKRDSDPYTSKRTGVQGSQYTGTRFEGKSKGRRSKAEKVFNKAQEDLAKGKKLSKRQQSFVDEHQYNVKRAGQKAEWKKKDDKRKEDTRIEKQIFKETGLTPSERQYKAEAEAQKAFSTPTHKGGIGDFLTGPGVEEAAKKAGVIPETDMESVDVSPPKRQQVKKKKGYYSDTEIRNPERTNRTGHRVDFTEAELRDMQRSQKPNKYGLTPQYNQKGEIEYHQNVPQWMTNSGNQEAIENWKKEQDKRLAQRDVDYEAQFGSDSSKENRDYSMLEGYNTHTNRTRKQMNKQKFADYAAGNLSEGHMAHISKVRKKEGWGQDESGRYTVRPRAKF